MAYTDETRAKMSVAAKARCTPEWRKYDNKIQNITKNRKEATSCDTCHSSQE